MVSRVVGQIPLLIIHSNRFEPIANPVTPEVGLPGLVTIAPPLSTTHVPVPTVAELPARVVVVAQTVWSGPAFATVGASSLVMVTVSLVVGHVPFVIVQTNVFAPRINPVTADVGELGAVTVALPAMTVHTPVPGEGVLPASVAVAEQTV